MNSNTLDRQLNKYYHNVRSLLPCDRKTKQRILTDLRANIANYLQINSCVHFEDIQTNFGTPEEIAENYIGVSSAEDIRKGTSFARKLITILTIAAVAAIIIWVISVRTAWTEFRNDESGHNEVEIIDSGVTYTNEEVNP